MLPTGPIYVAYQALSAFIICKSVRVCVSVCVNVWMYGKSVVFWACVAVTTLQTKSTYKSSKHRTERDYCVMSENERVDLSESAEREREKSVGWIYVV